MFGFVRIYEGVKVENVQNIENNIQKAKITVKKNNGVCEAFSYEKLLKSLVMVDVKQLTNT